MNFQRGELREIASSRRLLAVDIGNTAYKFGLFDLPGLLHLRDRKVPFRYPFSLVDLRLDGGQLDLLPSWIKTFDRNPQKSVGEGNETERFLWGISSVHRQRLDEFATFLRQNRPDDLLLEIENADIPIRNDYDHPEKLGTDRLLAACAASRVFPKSGPVLIIDIGTALKIDLVEPVPNPTDSFPYRFSGGVILPGPETQARSLFERTDRLPALDWRPRLLSSDYPATETETAIRLGIGGGLLGTILYFYSEAMERTKNDLLPIVLTGGGAIGLEPILEPFLAKFFPTPMEEEDDVFSWQPPRRVWTTRDLILTGIALTTLDLVK